VPTVDSPHPCGLHPFALRARGKPVYDGYLTSSASGVGLPGAKSGGRRTLLAQAGQGPTAYQPIAPPRRAFAAASWNAFSEPI